MPLSGWWIGEDLHLVAALLPALCPLRVGGGCEADLNGLQMGRIGPSPDLLAHPPESYESPVGKPDYADRVEREAGIEPAAFGYQLLPQMCRAALPRYNAAMFG